MDNQLDHAVLQTIHVMLMKEIVIMTLIAWLVCIVETIIVQMDSLQDMIVAVLASQGVM